MKLKLIYSHGNVSRPILAEVIANTGVLINILEAKVTPQSAEMVIDIPEDKHEEIIKFLRSAGVKVKQISKFIEFDRDKCISCGACVSPCPIEAIKQDQNWNVHFEESKCVGCRLCVNACPVHAIKVS